MERTSEELLDPQPQSIKGRVLSVVGSARDTATAQAANATAIARNPLGMAIGSVAIGFLAGMVLPITDFERERLGRYGEHLSDEAKAVAATAIEDGKTAVSMVIDDALSRASDR